MKRLFLSLTLALAPALAMAQAPPVGSTSANTRFALFFGGIPFDSDLAAHEGKIVALMYYTPW